MSFKIGLMGCGNVASYGHLPAIRDTAGLELHALYDPDADRVRDFASPERFNVPHACDTEEAFFAAGLDAVVITSPAPFHEANAASAARYRLPVLCEKPLAMDKEQGQRMIDTADAAGVPLYVAFCYRFSPSALKIKELVAEGAIGEVRSLRLIYNWDCHGKYNHRDPAQGVSAFREGRMLEGGPMVDCGTHQMTSPSGGSAAPLLKRLATVRGPIVTTPPITSTPISITKTAPTPWSRCRTASATRPKTPRVRSSTNSSAPTA
ncbi:MAG: Gfo/Idh/MocA family oxidoreductase [Planctomycetota bacterium]